MCIIAAKPAGKAMPTRDTIRTMWAGNPDGAGVMYAHEGKVRIDKGFMKLSDLEAYLDKLEREVDLTATGVVLHFRITTHGGTRPENCHPFPLTDSLARLRMTHTSTTVGIAHNGVIPITPRDQTTSDTMEYIASQLAPLGRALPGFWTNPDAMTMIQNAIHSRMVFLTGDGELFMTGDFVEHDGVFYSNHSYEGYGRRYAPCYAWGGWDTWDDAKPRKGKKKGKSKSKTALALPTERRLMWLTLADPDAYVTTRGGAILEGEDFLLDGSGRVYQYDLSTDMCVHAPDAQAFTGSGLPMRYDPDNASIEYVFD